MSDEDLDKNILSVFSNKNASKKPRKRTMKDDDDDDEDSYDTSEDIDIEDGAMDDDTDDTDDDRSSAPKKRGPAKKKGRARDFSDDDDDDDDEDSEDDDEDLDIMEDRASERRGQKTKGAKGTAGKKAPAKKGRQASAAAAPAKGRGKKAPVPFQNLSLAKDLALITAEGLKYGIEFESLPYGPDNFVDYNERERLTREMQQIELETMLYERSEEQNQIRVRNDIKFQQLKDLKAKELSEDKKTASSEKPRRSTRQTASQKKPRRSLASRKAALSGDESESDSYDESDGSLSDSASDRDDDSDDYHDRTLDSIDSDLSFGATPAKSSRKAYDPRSATSSSAAQAEKEPVVEEDPTKVTVKDVRKAQILRSDLEYFFDKPNMKEYLQNTYVRLMIGTKKDNEKVYRMCEITGISERKEKKYKFFNTETNIHLTLRHGQDKKEFSMDVVSNQPITEEEFTRWWSNLSDPDLVTKQTIHQKVEELERFKTEIKEDLNSFQRMTELRCQIKIALDAENEPEVARLRDVIEALNQKIKQRKIKTRRELKTSLNSDNSTGVSSLDLSQVHPSRNTPDFVIPRSSGPPAHKLFNSNFDFELRINTDLDHSLLSETEAQKLDRLAKSIKFFDAKRPYNVISSNE
eukprot:TRINITY_DN5349_c0_g1_i1.p1 TRINITY_DN5349_c0_g1~~TRINITY_DN5349_c0_g1_i1.p1  ORF type:complete len:636 (-),score=342.40 TRINITY_DN5349_c0_g1_i1:28-1935(-)